MVSLATAQRVNVTLTLPEALAEWVVEKVKLREFATRNHAVEAALIEFRKNEKKSQVSGERTR